MNNPYFFSAAGGVRRLPAHRVLRAAVCFVLALFCLFPTGALATFGDGPASDEPLTVGGIEIEGNQRTDTGVILRQLGFTVGDPFTYEMMDTAWDRLEDCGYFAFVDMIQEENGDGTVTVLIEVEEEMTTSYNVLLGYTERHKYELGGYLQENNLRGKGEVLRFDFTGLYAQRARLSWTRPWLLGVRGLEAEVAGSYFAGNFVYRPTDFRQATATLDLSYRFQRGFFLRGGARYQQDDYRDQYRWPQRPSHWDTGEGESLETSPVRKEDWTSVGASVGFDSRNNPLYPTRGLFLEAGLRSWFGNWIPELDQDYNEYFLEGRAFVPLPWKQHVLALRGYHRHVSKASQLSNMLYWGGAQTLRGYPLGTMQGDQGILLSAEYRVPLFLMPISVQGELLGFGLHAFADWGKMWIRGTGLSDDDFLVTEDPLYSYGGGAHINFMSQQFRFEGACNKDGDWRFQFADTFNF